MSCEVTTSVAESLARILDAAIAATRADFGNVQLVNSKDGALHICVQRGFDKPFLDFFRVVQRDKSACSAALQSGRRIVVIDTQRSRRFTRYTRAAMLEAGALSCQSTPIVSRNGRVLGMISTHSRVRRRPTARALARVDTLASVAAAMLEMARGSTRGSADVSRIVEELRDTWPAKSRTTAK